MRYPVERICGKPSRRSTVQEEKSMSEQPLDRSRRALMHVAVGVVSAGLMFRMPQAEASDKMTRQQANACKVVEGEVSKDGWCKAFALAD
jgi:hypothetical protein